MNHVFLWRYYAGFAMALFLVGIIKAGIWMYKTRSSAAALVFCFMLMTLLASPAHTLVKWRPMRATPFMAYNLYFGVVGLSLLMAYLTHLAHTRIRNRYWAWTAVVLIWGNMIFCAFARPPVLTHLAGLVKMGVYPDPWAKLCSLIAGS